MVVANQHGLGGETMPAFSCGGGFFGNVIAGAAQAFFIGGVEYGKEGEAAVFIVWFEQDFAAVFGLQPGFETGRELDAEGLFGGLDVLGLYGKGHGFAPMWWLEY